MKVSFAGMEWVKSFVCFKPCLISACGNYKVVQYTKYVGGLAHRKVWHAYFRPKGWTNFGNSVQRNLTEGTVGYGSIKEALQICSQHKDQYPKGANEEQRVAYQY